MTLSLTVQKSHTGPDRTRPADAEAWDESTYFKKDAVLDFALFKFLYFLLYVSEHFACMYVYVPCVYLVHTEARRVHWIPLELKLQKAMNHYLGKENWTLVPWKMSQSS